MKIYHVLAIILAGLMICNIVSPALAGRDDQTGDCLKTGRCKD